MKKLLITFGVFIFLLTPALAFASTSYVPDSGSLSDSGGHLRVDNGGACAASSDCDNFWNGLTTGDTVVIEGNAYAGTYTFNTYIFFAHQVVIFDEGTSNEGTSGGGEICSPDCDAPSTFTLTYSAGSNGSISGDTPQTVNSGDSGTAVTAVPDSGYQFTSWSDSSTDNPRTDTDVTADISVTASFSPVTPSSNPIGDYLNNAESGFSSTTGFDIIGLINWSGTNLVELFIGTGLALLFDLRYWIVALVVIGGVLYFSFRAFRFFRS